MCLGRTHALVSGTAGLATGMLALHLHGASLAGFTALSAAFGPAADIDQHGSCASRSLGLLSGLIARGVHWAARGHRGLTHTIPGAATFAALAWAGAYWRHDPAGRWGLALLLAIAFTGGARALAIPGHLDDLTALAAAVAMAVTGWGLALVPAAAFVGVAAHIAADGCTDQGIPLLWPLRPLRYHVNLLPEPFSFTTGSRPERAFTALTLLALGLLGWHAASLPIPHHI